MNVLEKELLQTKQGRIQDFKLGGWVGGGGGALNIFFGVFRMKNHDFTPKNHIFSNLGGGGGGARRVCPPPPPGSAHAKYPYL